MTDYSQYGEQASILAACDCFKGGRFWDLGAWDPFTFSNTRALYESGWSGVMVEPSPIPLTSLLKEYGQDERVTIIAAAVAIEPGLVPMHITDDATSTTSEANYETWRNGGGWRGKMLVPVITLEQLAGRFGGADFVNIDVEGQSVDLFARMMDLGIFPPCVCVEHDGRTTELLSMATCRGYHAALVNGTNAVVVR